MPDLGWRSPVRLSSKRLVAPAHPSFPVEKAFDGLGEVMLAYEMNGEDLPRDHGYPVRMLIPGHVGARQVKWLHKIVLSNEESKKSYQCKSYRHFAPDITFEKGES